MFPLPNPQRRQTDIWQTVIVGEPSVRRTDIWQTVIDKTTFGKPSLAESTFSQIIQQHQRYGKSIDLFPGLWIPQIWVFPITKWGIHPSIWTLIAFHTFCTNQKHTENQNFFYFVYVHVCIQKSKEMLSQLIKEMLKFFLENWLKIQTIRYIWHFV